MLRNDIRYALRLMRRSPGFTAVAVLSLALGIGANTAIFSLLNTVMLRTLPVAHPEQLVEFLQKYPGEPRGDGYWGWTSYEHFRDHNHIFSALTGTSFDNLASVRAEGSEPETLILENVLGNYFEVLGLKPAIGRLTTTEDVPASGDAGVVVVSWHYWNRRFHRDPAILGKRIFVTSGRQGLAAFAGYPDEWFLVRCVDPPGPPLPPRVKILLDRGPYHVTGEKALLSEHRIDVLVTKDSGGDLTSAKLTAARESGIPVVLVRRPPRPAAPAVGDVAAAVEWVLAHRHNP